MAKRLSEQDKKKLVECFTAGITIDELSQQFRFTKLTIIRNLKKDIGEEKYKKLISQSKTTEIRINSPVNKFLNEINNKNFSKKNTQKDPSENEKLPILENDFSLITPFTEIAPLDFDIDNSPQKDLSSVPIEEAVFPRIVYIIVDKKTELEIKFLRDYPEWEFLSKDELDRRTIEIYYDLKFAKRCCNKEQKVVKVPNTNVFKIAATKLKSKGISRIVASDTLIAL